MLNIVNNYAALCKASHLNKIRGRWWRKWYIKYKESYSKSTYSNYSNYFEFNRINGLVIFNTAYQLFSCNKFLKFKKRKYYAIFKRI